MPFEPLDALDGIEKHRLDQVEAFARCNHKFPLGQTFAPFFSRLAVGDDSRTQTQRGASPAFLQVARDASRSDRTRVVEGKRVSVRVALGGRRIFKKKNTQNTTYQ